MPIKTQRHSFRSGGKTIAVETFQTADTSPRPAVLMLHGADGLNTNSQYREGARNVAAAGYQVHLVDPLAMHVQQARRASAEQPAAPLASLTTYTATVSGAKDLAGNPMAGSVSWSFTTGANGVARSVRQVSTFSRNVGSSDRARRAVPPTTSTRSWNGPHP